MEFLAGIYQPFTIDSMGGATAAGACRGPKQSRVMVLPVDASCEDLEVDPQVPFLNAFVQQALNSGRDSVLCTPAALLIVTIQQCHWCQIATSTSTFPGKSTAKEGGVQPESRESDDGGRMHTVSGAAC